MDDVDPELETKFNQRIKEWKEKFQDALQSKARVSKEIAQTVCVFPAGHMNHCSLPGHEHWLKLDLKRLVSPWGTPEITRR